MTITSHRTPDAGLPEDDWTLGEGPSPSAVEAEFDRLNALSLTDLATEVMVKGFGPGRPGRADDDITLGMEHGGNAERGAGPVIGDIASCLVPERDFEWVNPSSEELNLVEPTLDRISKLVAEGLQELEHASLVRAQLHTNMGFRGHLGGTLGRTPVMRRLGPRRRGAVVRPFAQSRPDLLAAKRGILGEI